MNVKKLHSLTEKKKKAHVRIAARGGKGASYLLEAHRGAELGSFVEKEEKERGV